MTLSGTHCSGLLVHCPISSNCYTLMVRSLFLTGSWGYTRPSHVFQCMQEKSERPAWSTWWCNDYVHISASICTNRGGRYVIITSPIDPTFPIFLASHGKAWEQGYIPWLYKMHIRWSCCIYVHVHMVVSMVDRDSLCYVYIFTKFTPKWTVIRYQP